MQPQDFLPTDDDVQSLREDMILVVTNILAYRTDCSAAQQQFTHRYSNEMCKKSDIVRKLQVNTHFCVMHAAVYFKL